ncbi:MAG: hypothetical protein OEY56_10415, partial [Cyclobacteriaceae bacterium]|nr:hypothetical protein [Cyclobacteriaceae bacterium]
ADETVGAADSVVVFSLIRELKGIEKYAIRDDVELLSSLLAHKGDSVGHSQTKAYLAKEPYVNEYVFDVVDLKNGYMQYAPLGAEATYTVTYWNLSDNAKLIATEVWGCGPVCSSDIRFEKYQNGLFERVKNQDVIPGIKDLESRLVPDYDPEEEPAEFKYKLPRGGKNIQFCLDDACIELVWQNGVFLAGE